MTDGEKVLKTFDYIASDEDGIIVGIEHTGGKIRLVKGEGTDEELLARLDQMHSKLRWMSEARDD